jgi:glycosyltransferase involved in cell wall biosynthesis
MTVAMNSSYYLRGLELAEFGRHEEALTYIQEHLRTNPDDAQAFNDAGAILHCLGRSQEAVDHFVKARALAGNSPEIIWNLVEAYLAVGKPQQAMQLLDQMEQMGILSADVLNRTATILLNQNDKANAIEMLLRSLQVSPEQKVLSPMMDVIKTKRPKIAFFCGLKGDANFLTDICEFTKNRFQVQFFEGQTVDQMYQLMKWSDISWFEWCTDMAVEASKLTKTCKTIVRLHRFEAYNDWPAKVQWQNIDLLVTVGNSFVKDALLQQVPDIKNRTHLVTIHNGVNLDKFKFVDRPRGKNIACIGYLNARKNPVLLLQCMQKLHYLDPQFRLFFAGGFQDYTLEQYVRYMVRTLNLKDVIFFDNWQDDVNTWLHDKHYIVSASVGESQGMGLLEGMACGLKPVIHNFPGAVEIFPSEFLFNISEEFCSQILTGPYEPQKYRRFVEERYPLKEQLSRINGIFTRFEADMDSQYRCTDPAKERQAGAGIFANATT